MQEADDDDDIYLDVTMFEEEDEGIVDLETAMLAPEEQEEDPFYFVRARSTGILHLKSFVYRLPVELLQLVICNTPSVSAAGPRSDVYQAARVGDIARIRILVEEEGVDVNQRDRWDSVPLYYACLAGGVSHSSPMQDANDSALCAKLLGPWHSHHCPQVVSPCNDAQATARWCITCWRPGQSATSTPLTVVSSFLLQAIRSPSPK